jgi:hypothetical protein
VRHCGVPGLQPPCRAFGQPRLRPDVRERVGWNARVQVVQPGGKSIQMLSSDLLAGQGNARQPRHGNSRRVRLQVRADRHRGQARRELGQQLKRLPLPAVLATVP